MSYLLENSQVISKQHFLDEEEKYINLQKYPLGDHIIITENEKPFFSIYDIANYCKKKYKDSKLFLIAHRFYDRVAQEKVTEFYMLNTVNIFDKSLTSCLVIRSSELITKQKVVQDNLFIAKQMLNVDTIHIILGDNVKEHEVVEYITGSEKNASLEVFDTDMKIEAKSTDEFKFITTKTTRISAILKSIRILEPQKNKVQKNILLMLCILLAFYVSDEYMHTLFENDIRKEKRDKNKLDNEYRKYRKDVVFKEDVYNQSLKVIKDLSKKEIYIPESKK